LIAAISPARGLVKYSVRIGSVNSNVFSAFIHELLSEPAFEIRSHVVVMDNVAFHKTQQVKDVFSGVRLQHKLVYLPPYSPQLNPIELCFSKWKSIEKRQEKQTKAQLITAMNAAAQEITRADCAGWYREVMRFYVHCAAGNPLDQ
jgi:transposase